ncbi:hypothetical protein EGH10_20865 [Brevibacillus laterosporus]|uniref:Group I intron endonuclease n=1 Tax=Brevibacillus laterosporus LMG 15441 TaxID=1042163 RepID=A0A075R7P2_BRELA|nr:GIY-YIG nuclease family protein [Brevibacillus laterosporus]AIG27436.1 group I intron endonuclease [Brevibacillus laterosporus LMG 15441]RJL15363.1 hypothetical protein DM460_00250 [Brevibacillus laterosporus]TPH06473.1 hypothetical protein EGH10_20865 [Brevibacillus laterosporus]
MESGVYKITCLVNRKIYIGSSKDAEKRHFQHWQALKRGTHHNIHLQRAWAKYGEENFSFEIIEKLDGPPNKLIEREQYWLDQTKCYMSEVGFNIATRAGTPAGGKGFKHVMIFCDMEAKRIWDSLSIREAGFLSWLLLYLDEENRVMGDNEIGKKGEPLNQKHLMKLMRKTKSFISKHIKSLQDKGLIFVVVEGNKRTIYVSTTIAMYGGMKQNG